MTKRASSFSRLLAPTMGTCSGSLRVVVFGTVSLSPPPP
jgi:hypothetical protein